MLRQRKSYYEMRDRAFRSLYAEMRSEHHAIARHFSEARRVVEQDAIDFELIHDGMIGSYFRLLDALEDLVGALFEVYPAASARLDVTKSGITLLFVSKRGADAAVHTLFNVGWIYQTAEDRWDESLRSLNALAADRAVMQS